MRQVDGAMRRAFSALLLTVTTGALVTSMPGVTLGKELSMWLTALQQEEPQVPTLPETVIEATPQQQAAAEPVTDFPLPSLRRDTLFDTAPSRAQSVLGSASSGSQGVFGQPDLELRPIQRPGRALEIIPGLIVTQHSGSGKANQYFLRGVNLDHGTDFFLRVDGVPVNLPSHGHGQGYLDINWLIPELMERVDYRLGTYYADVGDFTSVGTADITMYREMPRGLATVTAGMYDYYRVLVADSEPLGQGTLLYAYESVFYDGPWGVPEDYNKFNGVLKYSLGDDDSGMSISLLGYRGHWAATNQIAQRAVDAGLVTRFGSLDPTDGGDTSRVSGNLQFWSVDETTITRANIFSTYYDLDLYSNFTYFLDDPVNGDQIYQSDRRVTSGVNVSRQWLHESYTGRTNSDTIGFQFRNDDIPHVALQRTAMRQLITSTRIDDVDQQSWSVYYINKRYWTDLVRTELGGRGDAFRFHSSSEIGGPDGGTVSDQIFSPKTSLIIGPWAQTELFLNWGLSFHSNDARGVTAAVDPALPLARADGSEIGVRSQLTDNWNATATLWYLSLESELVFVGDAGTTEASGGSHRGGFNFTNYYKINDWFMLDADYAWVRPRFTGGDRVPNAVENVLSSGFTVKDPDGGLYATLRLTHYGPAALIEDNSARSDTTTFANLRIGYLRGRLHAALDILNLWDSRDNDITYFYESAPAGLGPAADYHFHPLEPVSVRGNITWMF